MGKSGSFIKCEERNVSLLEVSLIVWISLYFFFSLMSESVWRGNISHVPLFAKDCMKHMYSTCNVPHRFLKEHFEAWGAGLGQWFITYLACEAMSTCVSHHRWSVWKGVVSSLFLFISF